MSGKLIFFVVWLVLLLLFAGFNMKNISDISFGFYQFKDVPIFISLLFAFILGIIFSVPFLSSSKKKNKNIDTAGNINIFPVDDPKLTRRDRDRLKKAEKEALKAHSKSQTQDTKTEDEPPLL